MLDSNRSALGIIFPNTYDELVPELVTERLIASIPFAGRYRLIDFVISSMVNCGIDNISILGYKPKSGGGFSDFYELREYRQGDSLKNIHWKLSSKYDDLIVKEPSLPIYKEFTINAIFTDLAKENNNILARLYYICRYIIKKGSPCCATTNKTSYASQLKNDNDIKMFIRYLYKNTSYNSVERNFSHSLTYYIYSNREEVTEE